MRGNFEFSWLGTETVIFSDCLGGLMERIWLQQGGRNNASFKEKAIGKL